jgi:23S rRNA pseudouridine955/2504/2580 synthase
VTQAEQVRTFTVTDEDDGIRLDRWFKRNLPEVSFGLVSRWARTGQLRLDGKRATPGDRILAGQSVRVPPQSEEAAATAAAAPSKKKLPQRHALSADEVDFVRSLVIHEDEAAIVVNKPPGLATQGGTKTPVHLDGLLDGLAAEGGPRPKLVHRLDKDTSGILLVARTPRAAAFFSKSFSGRTARKVYWALVVGVPPVADGMIDLPLAKQPGSGGEKMHVDESEGGQPARTRYRVIERAGNRAAWIELQPLTGRTHQLRVHMLAIGHPIVGDGKYGGQDAFLTGAISRKLHLHARRLRIDHPDGGRIDVTADLAGHFAATMKSLGFDLALGDLPLDEVKFSETPEGKRKAASAAAKARRKDRKGERRSRGRG